MSDPLFARLLAITIHFRLVLDEAYSSVMFKGVVPPLVFHSISWVVPACHFSPAVGDSIVIVRFFVRGSVAVWFSCTVGVGAIGGLISKLKMGTTVVSLVTSRVKGLVAFTAPLITQ